jgi:hypothetical protein
MMPPGGGGTMARVELIAVSLEELGGATPTPGAEIALGGVRYRVLSVTPPKGRPSPRGRQRDETRAGAWKLLLRRPEDAAAANAARGGEGRRNEAVERMAPGRRWRDPVGDDRA